MNDDGVNDGGVSNGGVSNGAAAASPTIAIVGSGPSGCYAAQFLRKAWRDAEIVVIDRLTEPYGLVRYGVAPDHVGTRAIARQFDRLFSRDGVQFVPGVEIGRDLDIADLRAAFDIVVVATGLYADRPLPGLAIGDATAGIEGIYGSGRLTRLINGHPDESLGDLRLGEHTVIVGHGNVAIDLLRLFLTPPAVLQELGVAADVVAAITAGPLRQIDIVGRSLPGAAKFDIAMVRELARVPDVQFEIDDAVLASNAAGDPRHEALQSLVDGSPADATRTVRFHFGFAPVAVHGDRRVARIEFTAVDGASAPLAITTDSVCTAIGFAEAESAMVRRAPLETDSTDLSRGLLDDGLYCVGWLRRGPRGTIPENRVDARMVVDSIAADFGPGAAFGKPGYAGIRARLETARNDQRTRSATSRATVDEDPNPLHDLVKELN